MHLKIFRLRDDSPVLLKVRLRLKKYLFQVVLESNADDCVASKLLLSSLVVSLTCTFRTLVSFFSSWLCDFVAKNICRGFDDKNYRTQKSATQRKKNSSNAVW